MSEQKRKRVTLCMIVRNEAHQLADCLTPVADLFDEIVIVDTGSVDETAEVARRFTPNVYSFEWCDNFSAARNEMLSHAHGEWVFWLDADDRLSTDNVARLKATLAALPDYPAALMMDTMCLSHSPGMPETLISHPRLFWRHPDLCWQGRVHEQLQPAPTTLGLKVIYSDVKIEHVGYGDKLLVQKKLRRDLRLLRMDFAVDPDDASTLFHMGQVHAQMGNAAEARKCLSRLFQVERSPAASHMRRVFAILCELAMREGQYQEVLAMAERGLALFPRDPHMSYILAEALYELDQYKAAEELLIDIINQPESLGYHAGTPKNLQRNMAMQSLGEVLRIQGAHAASEAVLRQVVQAFPRDTMAWYTLGRLYVDMGTVQGFEEVCSVLQECPEGKVFAKLLLGVWHLVRSNHLAAEPVVNELIAEAPHMPLPRLIRAFCLERRGAALADRLLAYRDVLRVQPGNVMAVASVARLEAAIAEVNQAALPAPPAIAAAAPSAVVIGPTRARVPATATSAAAGPQEWCTSTIVGVAS